MTSGCRHEALGYKSHLFGCWIGLEDEEGLAHNYRIVGPDEFDLNQGL